MIHSSAYTLRGAVLAASLFAALSSLAQDIVPFADPSRTVVVGGSLTEIVFALGEADKLVARDSTAVFPPQVFELPDIGYMRALAPEGVLSVDPTALLVIEGSGPPETLDVLAETGVQYQTVAEDFSADGVRAKIRSVGMALGVDEKAETLIAETDSAFAALDAQTAAITVPTRVLFVLSMQDGALMVSGTGTAADAAIGLAGAVNVVDAFEGYRPLTDEAVIAAAPEAILVMENAGGHELTADTVFAHAGLAATPAAATRTLIGMDAAFLLGFGPRAPQALSELADRLAAVRD